jgi:uncharacterized protein (DUF4415 family)
MEEEKNSKLAPEFEGSAAPQPDLSAEALAQGERVTVTLDLDADVVEWLKAQPLGLQDEIRTTMRFFMETSNQQVPPPHEFDPFTYDPEVVLDPV